jgi:hypothetical protein
MANDMELTLVQPMSPSGMVRISNGSRQRCVWPVHLPGWLALGWQVAGSTSTPAPGGVSSIDPPMQAAPPAPEPAQSRRRGRKAKATERADIPDPTDSSLLAEIGAASSDANAAEPLMQRQLIQGLMPLQKSAAKAQQ